MQFMRKKKVDNHWRGVVQKHLEVNVAKLQPLKGKSVLDVGCGSGKFCLEYAKNEATRVLGVDFAPGMIEIADRLAKGIGVQDQCEYRVGTFPETERIMIYPATGQPQTVSLIMWPNRCP